MRYRPGKLIRGQEFSIRQELGACLCSRAPRKVGLNVVGRLGDVGIVPSSPRAAILFSYVVPGWRIPLPL